MFSIVSPVNFNEKTKGIYFSACKTFKYNYQFVSASFNMLN